MTDGFRWANVNDYIGSVYDIDTNTLVCGCFFVSINVIMTQWRGLDSHVTYRFEFPVGKPHFLKMQSGSPGFDVALFVTMDFAESCLPIRAVGVGERGPVDVYVPCETGTYIPAKIMYPASNDDFYVCDMKRTPAVCGFPMLDVRGAVVGMHTYTNKDSSISAVRMDTWLKYCYEFTPERKSEIQKKTGFCLLCRMEPLVTRSSDQVENVD